jgi:molybdenum cofactor cytidylyltransferase
MDQTRDVAALIPAIVLAAGEARRFGGGKLLVSLAGRPLIHHTVSRVLEAGVSPVFVVVSTDALDEFTGALAGLPVTIIPNPAARAGIATSIRAGVSALPANAEAVWIVLGDQPMIEPRTIAWLLDSWVRDRAPIVVPQFRGEPGHPVLFARTIFPELLALDGDRGARNIIEREPERVTVLRIDSPAPRDIDTRQDFAMLRAELDQTENGGDAP